MRRKYEDYRKIDVDARNNFDAYLIGINYIYDFSRKLKPQN